MHALIPIDSHPYRKLFGEAPADEIEAFREDMFLALEEGRVDFTDPRAHALTTNFQAAGAASSIIYDLHWTLLRRPAGFVTSDRGLAMHDPKPRFPWSGQAWASSPYVQVTIPLTSACCLLSDQREQGLEVADAGEDEVDGLNLRTYGWAGDYIYGHSQDPLARMRGLAKRRPGDVVRPIPQHFVALFKVDPADRSLAEEHRRRGWPPYLMSEGALHDYVVIGPDQNPVEQMNRVTATVRERARRAIALQENQELSGRVTFEAAYSD